MRERIAHKTIEVCDVNVAGRTYGNFDMGVTGLVLAKDEPDAQPEVKVNFNGFQVKRGSFYRTDDSGAVHDYDDEEDRILLKGLLADDAEGFYGKVVTKHGRGDRDRGWEDIENLLRGV